MKTQLESMLYCSNELKMQKILKHTDIVVAIGAAGLELNANSENYKKNQQF